MKITDPFRTRCGSYISAVDRINHLEHLTIPELCHVINGPYQKTVRVAAARTLKRLMAHAGTLAQAQNCKF